MPVCVDLRHALRFTPSQQHHTIRTHSTAEAAHDERSLSTHRHLYCGCTSSIAIPMQQQPCSTQGLASSLQHPRSVLHNHNYADTTSIVTGLRTDRLPNCDAAPAYAGHNSLSNAHVSVPPKMRHIFDENMRINYL